MVRIFTKMTNAWNYIITFQKHSQVYYLLFVVQVLRACSHDPGTTHCPGATYWPWGQLWACSHEPGTMNYSGVMIAPGQPLPRVRMMIFIPGQCCPQSPLLPWGKFIDIWSLWIYLNSFSFYTNCCREWILNTFTYFWCFLALFIGEIILNISNDHAQGYSCPRATFAFCSHGEKLHRQGRLPSVIQRVTRLSKLPRDNEKLMWTVTGVKPCTEAKLTPRPVSFPRAMSCPGIMWTGPLPRCTVRRL